MSDQAETHLKETAAQTKKAAEHTAVAAKQTKDSADRRTELAADRTVFAAERTYAAWVRTGLVALASGIGARKLLEGSVPHWMGFAAASVLLLFSAFSFIAGVWRHVFSAGPPPNPDVPRLPPWLLALSNVFLAVVALTAMVGIWIG